MSLLEKYKKLLEDKCGVSLSVKPPPKTVRLINELREAVKPKDIMILCDMITDELNGGIDTNGFKFK